MPASFFDDKPHFADFTPPSSALPSGGKARKSVAVRRGKAAAYS